MKDLKQFIVERYFSNNPFDDTLEKVIEDSFKDNKRVQGYERWLELLGGQHIDDSMIESMQPKDGLRLAYLNKGDVIVWVSSTRAIAITVGDEIICAGSDIVPSLGQPLVATKLKKIAQSATRALLLDGLKLKFSYKIYVSGEIRSYVSFDKDKVYDDLDHAKSAAKRLFDRLLTAYIEDANAMAASEGEPRGLTHSDLFIEVLKDGIRGGDNEYYASFKDDEMCFSGYVEVVRA